jgi:hypothetical protein
MARATAIIELAGSMFTVLPRRLNSCLILIRSYFNPKYRHRPFNG